MNIKFIIENLEHNLPMTEDWTLGVSKVTSWTDNNPSAQISFRQENNTVSLEFLTLSSFVLDNIGNTKNVQIYVDETRVINLSNVKEVSVQIQSIDNQIIPRINILGE